MDIIYIFTKAVPPPQNPHMTLENIEQAIKGQFIFKKKTKKATETEYEFLQRVKAIHRLHVDPERECVLSLALIIFCGIAEAYNMDEDKTIEYLGITSREYNYYLGFFDKYLNRANEIKGMGRKIDPCQPYGKFYNKLGMVRNRLQLILKK